MCNASPNVLFNIFNKMNSNLAYFDMSHNIEILHLNLRLGGRNGMEWKWMKRIILEYSSLPLFKSFNGRNRKSILLFGSLSEREWNGYEGTLIPLYSLKTSNFHSPRNWEEWKGMRLNLMNFLLKLWKYIYIVNHLF